MSESRSYETPAWLERSFVLPHSPSVVETDRADRLAPVVEIDRSDRVDGSRFDATPPRIPVQEPGRHDTLARVGMVRRHRPEVDYAAVMRRIARQRAFVRTARLVAILALVLLVTGLGLRAIPLLVLGVVALGCAGGVLAAERNLAKRPVPTLAT